MVLAPLIRRDYYVFCTTIFIRGIIAIYTAWILLYHYRALYPLEKVLYKSNYCYYYHHYYYVFHTTSGTRVINAMRVLRLLHDVFHAWYKRHKYNVNITSSSR